jgi:hypothetical protein
MRKREEELFVVELFVLTYSQLCLMSVAQMEGQELFYFISSFFQAAKKKNREKIRKF